MKLSQITVEQFDQLVDELILTASQLRDASLQVISEEELASLQQRQQKLLRELEKADNHFHETKSPFDERMREKIQKKLQDFQQLNQEFIQNLNDSHGIIQFEFRRIGDERP